MSFWRYALPTLTVTTVDTVAPDVLTLTLDVPTPRASIPVYATPAVLDLTLDVPALTLLSGPTVVRLPPLDLTLDLPYLASLTQGGRVLPVPSRYLERTVYELILDGSHVSLPPYSIPVTNVEADATALVLTEAVVVDVPPGGLAAAYGGAILSTSSGASWKVGVTPIDGQPITAVRVAPSDTYRVYAGTESGEGSFLRSTDRGRTYERLTDLGVRVDWIAVDSSDENKVLVASFGSGVWLSEDGGETWVPRNSDAPSLDVYEVHIDGSTLYAASNTHGCIKSTNYGASWAEANTGLPGTAPDINGRSLVLHGGALYLAIPGGGVYKSTDSAATWVDVTGDLSSVDVSNIVGDPTDTSRLYVGVPGGVAQTSAGGTTWATYSSGNGLPVTTEAFLVAVAENGDIYAAVTEALPLGTDGPVYRSTAASSGALWAAASAGLAAKYVNQIVSDTTIGTGILIATPKVEDDMVDEPWTTEGVGYTTRVKRGAAINATAAYSAEAVTALADREGGRLVLRQVQCYSDGSLAYATLCEGLLASFSYEQGLKKKITITGTNPASDIAAGLTSTAIVLSPAEVLAVATRGGFPEFSVPVSTSIRPGDSVQWDSVDYQVMGLKYVLTASGRGMSLTARSRSLTQGVVDTRSLTIPVFSLRPVIRSGEGN